MKFKAEERYFDNLIGKLYCEECTYERDFEGYACNQFFFQVDEMKCPECEKDSKEITMNKLQEYPILTVDDLIDKMRNTN